MDPYFTFSTKYCSCFSVRNRRILKGVPNSLAAAVLCISVPYSMKNYMFFQMFTISHIIYFIKRTAINLLSLVMISILILLSVYLIPGSGV